MVPGKKDNALNVYQEWQTANLVIFGISIKDCKNKMKKDILFLQSFFRKRKRGDKKIKYDDCVIEKIEV